MTTRAAAPTSPTSYGGEMRMSGSALAILGIAILVSLGLWLSVRAAELANVELLPARSLRRVRWWQGNAKHVHIACAVLALAAACVQITSSVG
jgi:hypothetical protein